MEREGNKGWREGEGGGGLVGSRAAPRGAGGGEGEWVTDLSLFVSCFFSHSSPPPLRAQMQLQATLTRQRAALVIAEEQVRIIDLERECVEGVKQRREWSYPVGREGKCRLIVSSEPPPRRPTPVIHEHKLALFKSREEDLNATIRNLKVSLGRGVSSKYPLSEGYTDRSDVSPPSRVLYHITG